MKLLKKIARALATRPLFIYAAHYPSVFFGIIYFVITRKTPWISYWSMRKIYAHGGPAATDRLSAICNRLDPLYKSNEWKKNSIFQYTDTQVDEIVNKLDTDGYCILPFELPRELVESLTTYAQNIECKIRQATVPGHHKIDFKNPVGPWYEAQETDLLSNEKIISLAQDSFFLDVSKKYLGSTPVNDLIAMWWTIPYKNADLDLLAQKYHFDLDRFKFLKFFFYLTDVDEMSGPHSFIKGSHKKKAENLNQDRRYEDNEVHSAYGKENEIIMKGKKGLILAEDTRGFHKGVPPISGHRLMFQIEYATSLFGQTYSALDARTIGSDLYQKLSSQPVVWQRFLN